MPVEIRGVSWKDREQRLSTKTVIQFFVSAPPTCVPAENDHERDALALSGGLSELSGRLESPAFLQRLQRALQVLRAQVSRLRARPFGDTKPWRARPARGATSGPPGS